jgi:hypothetical protein
MPCLRISQITRYPRRLSALILLLTPRCFYITKSGEALYLCTINVNGYSNVFIKLLLLLSVPRTLSVFELPL